MSTSPTYSEILEANERIGTLIRQTPYEFSPFYSKLTESSVYLKLENQQITGSFKIRGALNAMIKATSTNLDISIVTASAGNHAQGVGFAAKMLGLEKKTVIYVPKNTPSVKIDAIMSYGVDLRVEGMIYDDAEKLAKLIAEEKGWSYISPYNHRDVIAGQGTIGLEVKNEINIPDVLFVPVSGGGLLAGILIAIKEKYPKMKIYGVQSEACPVMLESVRQKKIVNVKMKNSIAEGLHGSVEKGSITLDPIIELCDGILLVSESDIKHAIYDFIKYHNQICEGAGAVGLAAIRRHSNLIEKGNSIGVVITGRNIDFSLLKEIICVGLE